MEKNYNYYKVDVLIVDYGYSFMVASHDELDERDILDISIQKGYFVEPLDARSAIVDDLCTQRDIQHFIDNNLVHYID